MGKSGLVYKTGFRTVSECLTEHDYSSWEAIASWYDLDQDRSLAILTAPTSLSRTVMGQIQANIKMKGSNIGAVSLVFP